MVHYTRLTHSGLGRLIEPQCYTLPELSKFLNRNGGPYCEVLLHILVKITLCNLRGTAALLNECNGLQTGPNRIFINLTNFFLREPNTFTDNYYSVASNQTSNCHKFARLTACLIIPVYTILMKILIIVKLLEFRQLLEIRHH